MVATATGRRDRCNAAGPRSADRCRRSRFGGAGGIGVGAAGWRDRHRRYRYRLGRYGIRRHRVGRDGVWWWSDRRWSDRRRASRWRGRRRAQQQQADAIAEQLRAQREAQERAEAEREAAAAQAEAEKKAAEAAREAEEKRLKEEERARKAAEQAARAAAQARATWDKRGRPNKLIIVRQNNVDTITGGQLNSRTPHSGPLSLEALSRIAPSSFLSIEGDTAKLNAAVVLTTDAVFDISGVKTLQLSGGNSPSKAPSSTRAAAG